MDESIKKLSANFMKVYANVPLNVRDDIVLVVDDEPITWNVAYLEVKTEGQKTSHILKDLKELELI
jgi:hypothetical protein